jgi:hypothetical protein
MINKKKAVMICAIGAVLFIRFTFLGNGIERDWEKGVRVQGKRKLNGKYIDWWKTDLVEIGTTMDDWPARRATDAGWVYVRLGRAVYSEGLVVIITNEEGVLKIREIEWGRP